MVFQKNNKLWKLKKNFEGMKGHKHSKESKKRMGEIRIKNIKNGKIKVWNKGKKCPQISKANKGRKRPSISREKHPKWKGGILTNHGYRFVLMPKHKFAHKDGYVAEHRLVVEKKLGRHLTKEEVVHHVNGIKDDNRIENLELFSSQSEHVKLLIKENGKWKEEYLKHDQRLEAQRIRNADMQRMRGMRK